MTVGSIGARGFLSYTRKDNEQFEGVADKLKAQLEGRFAATTGRELEIFLDRESIGWGADWRARIRDSVKSATFFIPIITMRYFDSEACREELLAFYENAKQLGVTELILPIVLTGSDEIKESDPREEVRLIEGLNYKDVEEAWLSGYGSSEWLRAVHDMILGLKKGLAAAEAALADQETKTSDPSKVGLGSFDLTFDGDPETDSGPDLLALGEQVQEVLDLVGEANAAMEQFSAATAESMGGVDLGALPPNQQRDALRRIAQALREPAQRVGEVGTDLERKIGAMDARLRAVVEELRTISADMAQEQLNQLIEGFAQTEELGPVVEQMDEFVQVLRFVAMMNVSLRKSLNPAIQGSQSIGNAVSTFRSWRDI